MSSYHLVFDLGGGLATESLSLPPRPSLDEGGASGASAQLGIRISGNLTCVIDRWNEIVNTFVVGIAVGLATEVIPVLRSTTPYRTGRLRRSMRLHILEDSAQRILFQIGAEFYYTLVHGGHVAQEHVRYIVAWLDQRSQAIFDAALESVCPTGN